MNQKVMQLTVIGAGEFLLIATFVGVVASGILLVGHVFSLVL